ncbi:glycosyltransferase family 39 protein [Basidiobolus meristosporus CBS 931.73]|uniref:Dolichyl-phosphate-mannose--protein mannosyltransferase n=1 Tax=Basidiobolus meristosporus CBS 931.73 TaxID=1314790 RepID=A0A1Y1YF06_9FUNG|nr:glycosyltransferase family 39 protein [Basidiobolus meristosporus CBS 931.73]|eukprot:ORX96579.1 glycosyltransferase family 39 protein [Basidiobolus meristosporus CBS 931.73]
MVASASTVRKRGQLSETTDLRPEPSDDNGKSKSHTPPTKDTSVIKGSHLVTIVAITVLAMFVRFYRITKPDSVVFDEVHFGGFASKYIKSKFFMDVHPPLAKMMIAATGYFAGFNGDFTFEEIGMDYIEPQVPYVSMRLLSCVLGWLLVPMAYFTLRASRCSHLTASLGALLVTFENSYTTQFRYILLDSPLVFFTALTILSWVHFQNQLWNSFSCKWWFWLFASGVSLGLTGSVKWVGLFLYATIGLCTLKQLWDLLGDLSITPSRFLKEFMARVLCLIALPGVIYTSLFQVHLMVLKESGEGNGFMSPQFRSSLRGGEIPDSLQDIAYGAKVKIHHDVINGYLHSHPHYYPTGSRQQQVTLYSHRDHHNNWIITKAEDDNSTDTNLEWVKNGDVVRLLHAVTKKRLHSHDVKAPVTDSKIHFEVSGYEWGDSNDLWRVEIYDHDRSVPESADRLIAFHSKFRLIHNKMGCALYTHNVKLPKWGSEQLEVACMREAKIPKTLWVIDTVMDDRLPEDSPKINYRKPSFMEKFLELHKVMWRVNAGLSSYHPFGSRPADWPLLWRGISFWSKNDAQVYLMGNPIIWWSTSVVLAFFFASAGILVLRRQRGYKDSVNERITELLNNGGFFSIGWALHFLPFFLMARQLFLHHYLPALYFAILLLCVAFEQLTRSIPCKLRLLLVLLICITVVYVYFLFSPLAYGTSWTKQKCRASQWRPKWDFDCNRMTDETASSAASVSTTQIPTV